MIHRSPMLAPLLGALALLACSSTETPAPALATGGAGGGASTGGHSGSGGSVAPGGAGGGSAEPEAGSAGSGNVVDAAVGTGDASADAGYPIGDPGTMGDGKISIMPPYTKQSDLTDKGAPKGKSFHFTMSSSNSTIFKGDDKTLQQANQHSFMRNIDVYVPAQYKDGTPAPILVIHDGPGELDSVRNALDNLTISKDPMRTLPAFVAIAVQNGGGDGKGSERGLEYDTMSDRYARFIQTEVLPAVIADPMVSAAYPKLAFTDNPEGKATLGCSSGGAAALIMGWFRPDLFHRLITYSGTFVAQQNDTAPEQAQFPDGAWDFHSDLKLIANASRKDLRIFLNANENDNGAGAPESGKHNWVMANDRTAVALDAKAYHYRYVFAGQAGHCQGNVQDATLADTLVWMWRGYPAP